MPIGRFTSGAKHPSTCPPAAGRFSFGWEAHLTCQPGLLSGTKRPCTCPPVTDRFTFGRKALVYMPTGRRPVYFWARAPVYMPTGRFTFVYMLTGRRLVYFWARSTRLHAHRPQAGLLSGPKRTCKCPPAAGRFTFECEAPVYMPTCRRLVFFRVRSARLHAHRPQAGLLYGTERLFIYPLAACRFSFGPEAPVYMPTGRKTVYFRTQSARVHNRPFFFQARDARVHTHRPQVGLLSGASRLHAHLPQAGFLSGAKRPLTCPRAAGRFTSGSEVPVYMPTGRFTFVYMLTGRTPAYLRARSAHLHGHRPQAGLLLGPKRTCKCPPAAGRFIFGHGTPIYMPTSHSPV